MDSILEKFQDADVLKSHSLDNDILTLDLDTIEHETIYTVDTKSSPFLFVTENDTVSMIGTFEEALSQFLQIQLEKRQATIDSYELQTPGAEMTPKGFPEHFFDESVPKEESDNAIKLFLDDVKQARLRLDKNDGIGFYITHKKTLLCRFVLNTSWLSEWHADALEIDPTRKIFVELDLHWNYIYSKHQPVLYATGVYQSNDTDLDAESIKDKSTNFKIVKWFLTNRINMSLSKFWETFDSSKGMDKKQDVLKQDVKEVFTEPVSPIKGLKQESKKDEKKSGGFFGFLGSFGKTVTNVTEKVSEKVDKVIESSFFTKRDPPSELVYDGNLIDTIHQFLKGKFLRCCNNCVICDEPLGISSLKPTVCDKDLCVHGYENYGLGMDLEKEISRNPEVVDLLVTLTCYAAEMDKSTNGVRNLEPYPKHLSGALVKSKEHSTEVSEIISGIGSFPAIKKITESKLGMKEELDKIDKKCFPLFRWIITSNRTHLILAPKKYQLKEIGNCTQYIMISSNPERESVFRQQREKYGSFCAFHGSASGNWHNILRNGLKNYSGTSKMSAGQAHGPGIYTAPQLMTSVGYCSVQGNSSWKNSASSNVRVMALCEIVKNSSKYKDCNWCLVVQDESIIATRYLLVYTDNPTDVNASSIKLPTFN